MSIQYPKASSRGQNSAAFFTVFTSEKENYPGWFSGGHLTSDAGLLILREVDKSLRLSE